MEIEKEILRVLTEGEGPGEGDDAACRQNEEDRAAGKNAQSGDGGGSGRGEERERDEKGEKDEKDGQSPKGLPLRPRSFRASGAPDPGPGEGDKAVLPRPSGRKFTVAGEKGAEREKAFYMEKAEAEIRRIGEILPGYDSLRKVVDGPRGEEFRRLVESTGMPLDVAFRVAYGEEIFESRLRAREEAASGKDHLPPPGGGSYTHLPSPDRRTRELYHALLPGMSEGEIRADFAEKMKMMKNQRG